MWDPAASVQATTLSSNSHLPPRGEVGSRSASRVGAIAKRSRSEAAHPTRPSFARTPSPSRGGTQQVSRLPLRCSSAEMLADRLRGGGDQLGGEVAKLVRMRREALDRLVPMLHLQLQRLHRVGDSGE